MVAHPEAKLSDLMLLSDAERQQLVLDWNQTQRPYRTDSCVHHWVEEQVEKTPDAIAVTFEDQHLTYRSLNAQSNQLAHYLQSLGVGPEVPVGLCVRQSFRMAIGVLAILKAGGAYVPLDPNYPPERLTFMVEDTQAPILLTESELAPNLPQQGQVIALDRHWTTILQQPETNPQSPVDSQNLLYIIYTSGSTGRPKGIASLPLCAGKSDSMASGDTGAGRHAAICFVKLRCQFP
ncbi:MAG: AMP-binding protein [Acaryochloris sp. CRU_2_0]|nr:AMP-binding protein [Acaryochloris sp. CRU_2_0]